MKNLPSTRSLLMILCLLLCSCQEINRIHLDGTWTITLEGQPEATEIRLPGTTDTNHLGEAVTDTTLTTLLVPGRYTKGVSYDIPPLLAPNGCPVFSSHGRLMGVISNNKVNRN